MRMRWCVKLAACAAARLQTAEVLAQLANAKDAALPFYASLAAFGR
jgi:hypothetical protein